MARSRTTASGAASLPSKEQSLFRNMFSLIEHKHYKKAAKQADQILKKFPDHGETLSMKALILSNMGPERKQEAYELAKRGLRLDIRNYVSWHVLGTMYRADKDYGEATKCFAQAFRLTPEHVQIAKDLSVLQLHERRYEAFRETRRQILATRSQYIREWTPFALANHLCGSLDTAVAVVSEMEKQFHDDRDLDSFDRSELMLYCAMLLEQAGRVEECLAYLKEREQEFEEARRVYTELFEKNENNEIYVLILLACDSNPCLRRLCYIPKVHASRKKRKAKPSDEAQQQSTSEKRSLDTEETQKHEIKEQKDEEEDPEAAACVQVLPHALPSTGEGRVGWMVPADTRQKLQQLLASASTRNALPVNGWKRRRDSTPWPLFIMTREPSVEEQRLLLSFFERLAATHPGSSVTPLLALSFYTGDIFRHQLDVFLRPALRKGVISLFSSLKRLQTPAKMPIIVELLESYIFNLQKLAFSSFDDHLPDEEEESAASAVAAAAAQETAPPAEVEAIAAHCEDRTPEKTVRGNGKTSISEGKTEGAPEEETAEEDRPSPSSEARKDEIEEGDTGSIAATPAPAAVPIVTENDGGETVPGEREKEEKEEEESGWKREDTEAATSTAAAATPSPAAPTIPASKQSNQEHKERTKSQQQQRREAGEKQEIYKGEKADEKEKSKDLEAVEKQEMDEGEKAEEKGEIKELEAMEKQKRDKAEKTEKKGKTKELEAVEEKEKNKAKKTEEKEESKEHKAVEKEEKDEDEKTEEEEETKEPEQTVEAPTEAEQAVVLVAPTDIDSNWEDRGELPTCLLYTYIILAQQYDFVGRCEEALQAIDKAIKHTPTMADLYLIKGRILKHAGAYTAACDCHEMARSLDLADRYLNTKACHYLLRVNKGEQAAATARLFSRQSDAEGLHGMQCMWLEQKMGKQHLRRGHVGPALYEFSCVLKHFRDIRDDQFDFHPYCLRRFAYRSYIGFLRMQDRLYSHLFLRRAARQYIRIYFSIFDGKIDVEEAKRRAQAYVVEAQALAAAAAATLAEGGLDCTSKNDEDSSAGGPSSSASSVTGGEMKAGNETTGNSSSSSKRKKDASSASHTSECGDEQAAAEIATAAAAQPASDTPSATAPETQAAAAASETSSAALSAATPVEASETTPAAASDLPSAAASKASAPKKKKSSAASSKASAAAIAKPPSPASAKTSPAASKKTPSAAASQTSLKAPPAGGGKGPPSADSGKGGAGGSEGKGGAAGGAAAPANEYAADDPSGAILLGKDPLQQAEEVLHELLLAALEDQHTHVLHYHYATRKRNGLAMLLAVMRLWRLTGRNAFGPRLVPLLVHLFSSPDALKTAEAESTATIVQEAVMQLLPSLDVSGENNTTEKKETGEKSRTSAGALLQAAGQLYWRKVLSACEEDIWNFRLRRAAMKALILCPELLEKINEDMVFLQFHSFPSFSEEQLRYESMPTLRECEQLHETLRVLANGDNRCASALAKLRKVCRARFPRAELFQEAADSPCKEEEVRTAFF